MSNKVLALILCDTKKATAKQLNHFYYDLKEKVRLTFIRPNKLGQTNERKPDLQ